jgi:hypothetical protein
MLFSNHHEDIRKPYIKLLLKIKHHSIHHIALPAGWCQSDTEWYTVFQDMNGTQLAQAILGIKINIAIVSSTCMLKSQSENGFSIPL